MRRFALSAAFLALVCAPALAAQNGQLPAHERAPIAIPNNTASLAKAPAASWNTMRFCALGRGQDLYPGASRWRPAATAYRSFAQQRALYRELGPGTAAYPGTSNHGWGLAVDLATLQMRRYIDRYGAQFGWAKRWSDAKHEWWHLKFRRGVWSGPDPGTSQRYPRIRRGSRGCLASAVREVQRRLGLRQDGTFGRRTAIAVKRFQRRARLQRTGVVDAKTWRALRRASRSMRAASYLRAGASRSPQAGTDVRALQGLLNARLRHMGLPGLKRVDGVFGPRTERVVRRYQYARGLRVTGKADRRTWRHLRTPWRIDGPDVSVHQGSVDWRRVRRAGFELAFVKASEGEDFRDRTFSRERLRAARAAGLAVGVYHFLRPRAGRAGAVEARFFVRRARGAGWRRTDLPLVADIESSELGNAGTCRYLRSFLREATRLAGKRPLVYTYPGFASSRLRCGRWIHAYRLWIAHYGVAKPSVPGPWRNYALWQFSSEHPVSGEGRIDMNVLRGGKPALRRLRMP